MQTTWMAGDFGQIAKYSAKGAEEFVARLNIQPGVKVLDVACGTGNLSIPAARRGAKVTGIDIASNLLDQARQRAASEGLDAKFEEGDAEQLTAGTDEFDIVMAMFAPRPSKCLRIDSRVPARRNHRDGELDTGRIRRENVRTRRTFRSAS